MPFFAHESAYIDDNVTIGDGTKIWHFSPRPCASSARSACSGRNVNIGNDVVLGNGVKIQNETSVYTGTVVEDFVFLGPSSC